MLNTWASQIICNLFTCITMCHEPKDLYEGGLCKVSFPIHGVEFIDGIRDWNQTRFDIRSNLSIITHTPSRDAHTRIFKREQAIERKTPDGKIRIPPHAERCERRLHAH